MAFHMLQIDYAQMGVKIVDWKRLKALKSCGSFDLCRNFLSLMLDEMDRLAWGMFLCEKINMIQLKK